MKEIAISNLLRIRIYTLVTKNQCSIRLPILTNEILKELASQSNNAKLKKHAVTHKKIKITKLLKIYFKPELYFAVGCCLEI